MSQNPTRNRQWVESLIQDFMHSPANDLGMPGGGEPAFGAPLVGVAAGDDPLWDDFKQYVGEFHWTPEEAFALAFPGEKAGGGELRVVNWILPQTTATRKDQRREKTLPSERWARARIQGEFVNEALRRHLIARLGAEGIKACAPMLLPEWSRVDSEAFVFASTWSERHAAYAAGNGTFGLCDGLITPVGKSMRTGSLIVRLPLETTPRPYTSHREYCLFFSTGCCGACIDRCPAKALSEHGHDKRRCQAYIREVTAPHVEAQFHFQGYGCGFCQVGVPCESRIPARIQSSPSALDQKR